MCSMDIVIIQHAHALEILKDHLYEGARALDVGSGSGYLTACMGHMVCGIGIRNDMYSTPSRI